jgi:hypothetical protein
MCEESSREYHEAREKEFSGVTCFIHGRLTVGECWVDVNVPDHVLKLTCAACHPKPETRHEQG